MRQFIEGLPDGWTIYVWMVVAVGILVGVVIGLRWAMRNAQFDEDIKYVVFNKDDEEKMTPEEFAKHREVMAHQEELRDQHLKEKARRHAERNARR